MAAYSSDAVAELYADHHGWLKGWLRKKLGCAYRADDLVQDTFLRLLNREEVATIQEPRAYLTTIAQRVLVNYWRREQLERAYLDALANMPPALAPSVEERSILFETLVEIDRLLSGLPAQVKHAFLLAQLDGLSYAEISAELGISLSTVKRHLTRAAAQCYFALELK